MKLTLIGHDDRYAVEQLQMALFATNTEGEAVSSLHRGKTWLTATAKITIDGKTATASRRLKAAEETVRLNSHLDQLEQLLSSDEAVGRKLDFLVQEINRETNTIGSKCSDLSLTRIVVDIKAEIEKIREQIQNIE